MTVRASNGEGLEDEPRVWSEEQEHEQLLRDIWEWLQTATIGTGFITPMAAVRVMDVSAEFGLTMDEAETALKELGERRRRGELR